MLSCTDGLQSIVANVEAVFAKFHGVVIALLNPNAHTKCWLVYPVRIDKFTRLWLTVASA